jgi:hypothetical protein
LIWNLRLGPRFGAVWDTQDRDPDLGPEAIL